MKEATERRILRKPELMTRIGLSDASIWRMEKAGKFPKRIRLGGLAVGWFSDEIDKWFEEKAAARGE
jgi:prophage regulatory protein